MGGKIFNQAYRLKKGRYVPEGCAMNSDACDRIITTREDLQTAAECGAVVEACAQVCDCSSLCLHVPLPGDVHGVIPKSEAGFLPDGGELKDIALITRVGKPVQFKITEIYENEKGQTTATLSRRAAQVECWENYLSGLIPGDIIPAKITHIEPFGAFCDVGGGIISLLTIDRISVSRISSPADRFSPGDCIETVIASNEGGRIYLSHRELLGTWEENAAEFEAGQTVTGIIRSAEDYGVFIELTPNLAGLAESFSGACPGDLCSVYIKSIIPERMKVKLVLIDTCGKAGLTPLRYYVDTTRVKHIGRWLYSPEGCRKTVETVFDDKAEKKASESAVC